MKDHPLKGRKWTKEHKEKIRQSNIGLNKGRVPWNKGKPQDSIKGDKHWNWQGGKTLWRDKITKSIEYKNWRRAVFERDNYICVWCGYDKGLILNADHIKPFCDYPELRFEISNGRTLCEPCHRKTPSYLNNKGRNMYTQRLAR